MPEYNVQHEKRAVGEREDVAQRFPRQSLAEWKLPKLRLTIQVPHSTPIGSLANDITTATTLSQRATINAPTSYNSVGCRVYRFVRLHLNYIGRHFSEIAESNHSADL